MTKMQPKLFFLLLQCFLACNLLVPPCGGFTIPGLQGSTRQRIDIQRREQSSSSVEEAVGTKPSLSPGCIVSIKCDLTPEGDFVPEPLIDLKGDFTFVLGGGNYLPGLHDLVSNMQVGDTSTVSLDAGYGAKNPNLVTTIQNSDMGDDFDLSKIAIGTVLYFGNGMKAVVSEATETDFTVDANPPLAGASYQASVELLKVEDGPSELEYKADGTESTYQVATFALGCFWGGELDFMRQRGVVGTKVGYTQGQKENPTYEQVCTGTTGHTEAIQIVYDPRIVSFDDLVHVAMDRLGENKYLLNQVGNDRGTQYRHGIYYHNDAQKNTASEILSRFGEDCKTECLPAGKFFDAEDYHQQYLLKGGQSARKDDTTTIRCYG